MKYENVTFTFDQEQVILGSILGDGNLTLPRKGVNAWFRVSYKESDGAYLFWKFNNLKSTGLFKEPRLVIKNKEKKESKAFYLSSHCHPYFTELYSKFYYNGRKIITPNLLDKVCDLGLAVFYMDDGTSYYRTRGLGRPRVRLSTHNYTKEENEIIRDWIDCKWSIKFRVASHKKKYYLLSLDGWEQSVQFMRIVNPFMVPCMSRKIKERMNPGR